MSAIALFVFLSLQGAPSHADYLPDYSGNSRGDTDPTNGRRIVTFAVLDRLTGPSTAGDVFGTGLADFDSLAVTGGGSASFDTQARYLYLYQFVMSTESPSDWFMFRAGVTGVPLPITSYQQWSLFLADNSGNVSPVNDFGVDGIAFSPLAPANLGVSDPHVSAVGETGSLIGATFVATPTSFGGLFDSLIYPGQMSGLWGITSNAPPTFYFSPAGPLEAAATIPIPTPEASSLALLSAGAMGLAGLVLRRRRSVKMTTNATR
ncbi:MAG: PEP-CTERM sorting domain-containing protein [Pirellulales bacterium]